MLSCDALCQRGDARDAVLSTVVLDKSTLQEFHLVWKSGGAKKSVPEICESTPYMAPVIFPPLDKIYSYYMVAGRSRGGQPS